VRFSAASIAIMEIDFCGRVNGLPKPAVRIRDFVSGRARFGGKSA